MEDEELARLEERRECRYGGCQCCAKLVVANDELDRLQAEVERLKKALERFLLAVEGEDELLSNSADVWDAYEDARELLGHPAKEYPGGWEDMHFHLYEWKEGDHCDTCEDYRQAERAEKESDERAAGFYPGADRPAAGDQAARG